MNLTTRTILISFFIFLHLVGCENQVAFNPNEIESRWMSLYQKEGCLTGGQHWGPGTTEGSIFREKEWQRFFKITPETTIPFLMNRINSTEKTKIHVCPFRMATEGELAVYASEHILKMNWYDCESNFKKLRNWSEKRKKAASPVTQSMLLDIQANSELKRYFLTDISRKNF